MPPAFRTILSALLMIAMFGAATADTVDTVPQFRAALRRIQMGLPDLPDSAALRGYVIYDYLVAARLRRDLIARPNEDLDTTIDTFLNAHEGEPVGRTLRREWLLSLAARERWDWFLPRSADATEAQLVCERLRGLLATGETQGLANAALARWSLPQKQPAACTPVFNWLEQQKLLTPELAEARTRAALAADNPRLAREDALDLPARRAAPLLQWAQLLETPGPTLEALANSPDITVEPDALVAAFGRLARLNFRQAAAILPRLLARPQMSPALQTRLRRNAALGAAYDHDAAALTLFNAIAVEPNDESAQEWRARAALWAGDYAQAAAWIAQMGPSLATQPRWRYWHARAVAAISGGAAAEPLFSEIAGLRDYYGYLAADRLHRSYSLNAKPSPEDPKMTAVLAAEPGVLRARALLDCDLVDEAAIEWNLVFSHAEPAVKVQAARLANSWGWYAQAIATLAQSGQFDDVRLRYPRPFTAAIDKASRLTGVPDDLILAVMRQESLFRTDAVSRANARGLMQILPTTAAGVARRWHQPVPTSEGLFDPEVAAKLGAANLRELLDRYGGQLDLTLAAYNAGIAAVARWQPEKPIDADIWIENIPFNETRGYVQHILEHLVAFAWVRDAQPPQLTALLAPCTPATQSANPVCTATERR
jgi:soluble lytic murein transglycosylase